MPKSKTTAKKTINAFMRLHLVPVVLVGVVAGILIVIILISPVAKKVVALATTHQPERLTELYFRNYNAIPKHVTAGTTFSIPFSVVNHEARAMVYHYQIWQNVNGLSTLLSDGTVSLEDGQTGQAEVKFSPVRPGTTYQIAIKLLLVNQEISVRLQT